MDSTDMIVFIVNRERSIAYLQWLEELGQTTMLSFPCLGTAGRSLLDSLGLEHSEKTLILTFMTHAKSSKTLLKSVSRMGIDVPGSGIGFTIPLDSVGGKSGWNVLMDGQDRQASEVEKMEHTTLKPEYPCALIVAICESGHTDLVMDAARNAGARGGTVVHAKGTAGNMTKKFLGVTIAEEKEMILILVNRKHRNEVMQSVMKEAGIETPAHTVLFTLPVESVAGLQSILENEEDNVHQEA